VDPVALARGLIDIDSTTGREGEAGRWLARHLRELGFHVREQPVDAARFNVIATAGEGGPAVVLSTHFDCVPPFFASRVDGDRLYGRGACDAKGILAAQVAAVDRLRHQGETAVGLLFVVGEERGSDGARLANDAASGSRFLVNGEPTESRLGAATRGILRLKLHAAGRAAHSSFPELGVSAIDKLLDALIELRSRPLPEDAVLGRTHYTVGLISGGVAPNVVPPSAEAEVMFRTVGGGDEVRAAIAPIERRVSIEHVLEVPPVRLTVVPGFETAVFPYTTDSRCSSVPARCTWPTRPRSTCRSPSSTPPSIATSPSRSTCSRCERGGPGGAAHTSVVQAFRPARHGGAEAPHYDRSGDDRSGSGGTLESSGTAVRAVFIIIDSSA
jgi:acetylornithine deacetylase